MHGRRKGGPGPLDFENLYFTFKFLTKKILLLVSSMQHEIPTLLPPLEKSF